MKLKDILDLTRNSTRVQITDAKGNALTAPLHKRDLTTDYDNLEVTNICARYSGNGHTVRFHLSISISK